MAIGVGRLVGRRLDLDPVDPRLVAGRLDRRRKRRQVSGTRIEPDGGSLRREIDVGCLDAIDLVEEPSDPVDARRAGHALDRERHDLDSRNGGGHVLLPILPGSIVASWVNNDEPTIGYFSGGRTACCAVSRRSRPSASPWTFNRCMAWHTNTGANTSRTAPGTPVASSTAPTADQHRPLLDHIVYRRPNVMATTARARPVLTHGLLARF